MIPAGYLLKRVLPPPGWLRSPSIVDVFSVAGCVNDDVIDIQRSWEHNGFGVANDPEVLFRLAENGHVDTAGSSLFYYEVLEQEIESDGWDFDPTAWRPLSLAPSAVVATKPTRAHGARVIGYDVVVFGDFLEHSPLSCNSVAQRLPVNEHCLVESAKLALEAINAGVFGGGCGEGVYKIFSVNELS